MPIPTPQTIRAYQVLNAEATGQFKGMARPGYFFIDTKGVIREKFFEAKYRERLSGNNVIAKLFPELGEEVTDTVEAPHLQLDVEQSDRTGDPGSRITLTAEVRLPPDVHVYAPGTKGYKTINLLIDPAPGVELKPVSLPALENSLSAGHQGARACIRGHFPDQPGFAGKHFGGVQQFAWGGGKDNHDCGEGRVSGLRQQDLLSANLGSGAVAIAGCAP